ncbi:MAG: hypothetical protein AAFR47_20375 [Pseudomonadota bacterium]
MSYTAAELADGARNMLEGCAELAPGMSLLIIAEPPESGPQPYYDPGLAPAVAAVAEQIGAEVEILHRPFDPVVRDPEPALAARIDAADRVLFLARLGDQLRFRDRTGATPCVMSYALDREMLASPFGRIPHASMVALKALIDGALATADEIRVTCPAGTEFRAPGAAFPVGGGDTVTRRFPLSVFSPVPSRVTGHVAQRGFLCATGSQAYEPPACEIADTLFVAIAGDRLVGFDGTALDVLAAREHYDHVAQLFGLDRDATHSWHGGIHPGCAYTRPASQNFDRWSNGAFGNPRLLHFHTCGADPPGEISLNILDPKLWVGGTALVDAGRLRPERLAGGPQLLAAHPMLAHALAHPSREVGAPSGQLSFRDA